MRIKLYSGIPNYSAAIITIAIVILIVLAILFFVTHMRPIFCEYACSEAYSRATLLMCEAADNVFDDEYITYESFIKLKENDSGQITALEADTVNINRIKSKLNSALELSLNAFSDTDISIPLGTLLKNPIFQGYGPRIHMKTSPISTLKINYTDTFTSCGINQVRHSLYLDIYADLGIMCYGFEIDETVHYRVLIGETVIVGAVPEFYGGEITANAQ